MFEKLIEWIGRVLSWLPEFMVRALCKVLGFIMVRFTFRRAVYLNNLSHAFPDKDFKWLKRNAYECASQDFELFFLSVTAPHMSNEEILDRIRMEPEHRERLVENVEAGGVLALVPHVTLIESLAIFPLLDERFSNFGTMYRPLDFKPADKVVRRARGRTGVKLFATKKAIFEVRDHLRDGGLCGFLYDQNGGYSGAASLLFDRVCSTTELHGLFARGGKCRVVFVNPRRTGFWRGTIEVENYEGEMTQSGLVVAANAWLDRLLRSDETLVPTWLWGHKRWKHFEVPERRFNLDMKKDCLPETLEALGYDALPKNERLWFLLPSHVEGVLRCLPFLRAILKGRPDAIITVFAHPGFREMLEDEASIARVVTLPDGRLQRARCFWRERFALPDTFVCFEETRRSHWAAWLTRARQRFGAQTGSSRHGLLTHRFIVPEELRAEDPLSPDFLRAFLGSFGLKEEPVYRPVGEVDKSSRRIGLLLNPKSDAESERWPERHREHVRAKLSEAYPDYDIVEIGAGLTANALGTIEVRTDPMATGIRELRACRCAIGTDSEMLHLANALGIPTVALFDAWTPEEREPVFDAPARVLRPAEDPELPGDRVSDIRPEAIAGCIEEILSPNSAP